jgi:hypothetical protein
MTTMAMPMAGHRRWTIATVAAGITLGFAYTLSPLTVLSLGALVSAMLAASRGLS